MSVFKLQAEPVEQKAAASTDVENPDTPLPTEVDQNVIKDPATEQKTDTEGKPAPVQEIVLKGSLSHVYTQVLNLLMAKDSTTLAGESMQFAAMAGMHASRDKDAAKPQGVYIYVLDADKLSQHDVTETFNELAELKNDNEEIDVILGMESAGNFSQAARMLDTAARGLGVKPMYRRETIVNAVMARVQRR